MAAPALTPHTIPEFKNLLFATDFSDGSLRALPYVAGIAKAFGATVHLCHIITPTPLATEAAAPDLYEAVGKQATEELIRLFDAPALQGVDRELALAQGTIEDQLLKSIGERNIDLVVAGTHGRTGWRKLLLGSVVEAICRVATCPLLTVGPALTPHEGVPFKRILFPTDLSKESMSIVPYLASLSEKYESHVTVLHVLPAETETNRDARALSEPIRANMARCFRKGLAPAAPEFTIEFGDTVDTVLQVAQQQNADLIAMGIRNALMPGIHLRSSIAYRIIVGASCPVFTSRDVLQQ
jgi:nucleotide-binding universal stress UspA family protein